MKKTLIFTIAFCLAFSTVSCNKECSCDCVGKGPELVNLGLSVMWSSSNVGAENPYDLGDYYSWAETRTKSNYSFDTYKWVNEKKFYYKYGAVADGGLMELEMEDDVANVKLGDGWRIPSSDEWMELINNCEWKRSKVGGVDGYTVTGPNGNFIFLPFAGYRENKEPAVPGRFAYYHASDCAETGPYQLEASPMGINIIVCVERFHGFSVRPVYEPQAVGSDLKVFSSDNEVDVFVSKAHPESGRIFVETWNGRNYNPNVLCLDKDGNRMWGWKMLSTRDTDQYANYTLFDISSDGSLIDCFNAYNEGHTPENTLNYAYITKISPDGDELWGSSGKLFTDFGTYASDSNPCGSCVAATSDGGAWVTAWNEGFDEYGVMIAGRVDRNGDRVGEEVKLFADKGSAEPASMVTRGQAYVGADNTLFLLAQYCTYQGSFPYGFYDLVKISPDGSSKTVTNLVSPRFMSATTRARIIRDSKGGAYITMFSCADDEEGTYHIFLYHIDSAGTVDLKDVDIVSCNSSILTGTAVEKGTDNIAVVMASKDLYSEEYYIDMQVVTPKGEKLLGKGGEPLRIKTFSGKNKIISHSLNVVGMPESNDIFISWLSQPYQLLPVLKSARLDYNGLLYDEKTEVEIDRPFYKNTDPESQVYNFVDDKLLIFFRPNGTGPGDDGHMDFFGYVVKE